MLTFSGLVSLRHTYQRQLKEIRDYVRDRESDRDKNNTAKNHKFNKITSKYSDIAISLNKINKLIVLELGINLFSIGRIELLYHM